METVYWILLVVGLSLSFLCIGYLIGSYKVNRRNHILQVTLDQCMDHMKKEREFNNRLVEFIQKMVGIENDKD